MTTLFVRFLIGFIIVRVISAIVIAISIAKNSPDIAYYSHDKERFKEEVEKLIAPYDLYLKVVTNSIYASILGIILSLFIR